MRTYFLYDGSTVVCELNSAGQVTNAFGYGAAGLAQRYDGASTPIGYTFDPQGTLVQRHASLSIYDPAAVDTAVYDSLGCLGGDIDANTGASYSGQDMVGYCGQWGAYTDPRNGLVLMGHRYYDPGTGRFLTRDPIGYDGGINLYTYCDGDPVNCADPSGLDALDNVSNFFAGWGDTLTFGGTKIARKYVGQWTGVGDANEAVDYSSGYYTAGEVTGTVHSIAFGAAGGVKALVAGGGRALSKKAAAVVAREANAAAEAAVRAEQIRKVATVGRAGEAAVGVVGKAARIKTVLGGVAYRVPDYLNGATKVIAEVKNVKSLSYVRQLRDYAAWAQQNNYRFVLIVRQGTELSPALQKAVDAGDIVLGRMLK